MIGWKEISLKKIYTFQIKWWETERMNIFPAWPDFEWHSIGEPRILSRENISKRTPKHILQQRKRFGRGQFDLLNRK